MKNLFETLNAVNANLGLKSVITDKYNYPEELKKLDSKNKLKANFRHKIQKVIIAFLSKKEVTKTDFEQFNEFLTTFIKDFKGLKKDTKITEIYSFKVESNQLECEKVLKNYLTFVSEKTEKK